MNQYKKRLRIFAASLASAIDYKNDGGFVVSSANASLQITPTSRTHATCEVVSTSGITHFEFTHELIFDVVDHLSDPEYPAAYISPRSPLTIADMTNEYGDRLINELQQQIKTNGNTGFNWGGNRILMSYYPGILILRDDLCTFATNVIEFP